MSNEKDIAYLATHTFKHNLGNQFDQAVSTPIVKDSLAGLWALRNHPMYYSYGPNFEDIEVWRLTDFDILGSQIGAGDGEYSYGFSRSKRDFYRKLAEPDIVVPDVMDMFSRGILTDVVGATKMRVLKEGKLLEDEERARSYLQRKMSSDSIQTLRGVYADSHAYTTFIIGYCFPKLNKSKIDVSKVLGLEGRLEDPVSYVEKLIKSKLTDEQGNFLQRFDYPRRDARK